MEYYYMVKRIFWLMRIAIRISFDEVITEILEKNFLSGEDLTCFSEQGQTAIQRKKTICPVWACWSYLISAAEI